MVLFKQAKCCKNGTAKERAEFEQLLDAVMAARQRWDFAVGDEVEPAALELTAAERRLNNFFSRAKGAHDG